MSVHDWTRVEAGIFHDFHVAWIAEIRKALNDGLLPEGYYALAEQHAGQSIPDVLTLNATTESDVAASLPESGGTAVAEAPPKVRRHETVELSLRARRRTLAIRHVSGHRLVALIEILSPANKDRPKHLEEISAKVVDALNAGIHLLLVDLFPPGSHDPTGIHGNILNMLEDSRNPYDLPADGPLTLASYVADTPVEVYLEHLAPSSTLVDMPLFLSPERYVNVPLDATYMAAYRGMPVFWRNVLEGKSKP